MCIRDSINIDQKTIPSDSTIEYSINDGQTWNILNSNNDIPTAVSYTHLDVYKRQMVQMLTIM